MQRPKKQAKKATSPRKRAVRKLTDPNAPRCGLCGKRGKLVQAPCCGHWICDDSDKYVLFSYARNSCFRNHSRFTLCGYHCVEGHKGRWQDCQECRKSFETEMYVWYGTNEFNFEVLENPPEFEPTHCAGCGRVISLANDAYALDPKKGYLCDKCHDMPRF